MRAGIRWLVVVMGMLSAAGCTALRSGSETCETPGLGCQIAPDTGQNGPDAGDGYDWSCLQAEPPISTPPVTYTTQIINYSTKTFPSGLIACVCPTSDPALYDTDPEAGTVPCFSQNRTCVLGPTDGGNTITVPLPGFIVGTGYYYVTFEAPGLLPISVWFNTPPPVNVVGAPVLTMFDPMTIAGFAKGLQAKLDPTTALVVVTSHDCRGTPVAGARAALSLPGGSSSATDFVLRLSGLPVIDVEAGTDISGEYGFANVPTGGGTATVTAYRNDGVQIGPAAAVPIRIGWGTGIAVLP